MPDATVGGFAADTPHKDALSNVAARHQIVTRDAPSAKLTPKSLTYFLHDLPTGLGFDAWCESIRRAA